VNLVIPPILLYAFGSVLVVLGSLRAYYLGWLKRPDLDEGEENGQDGQDVDDGPLEGAPPSAPLAEGEEVAPIETPVRRRPAPVSGSTGHRRHLGMGLLYMLMGLFLIVSTALGQRR
jgi:hypothetical protein